MSLKPSQEPDKEEVKFLAELGWLTSLAVAIAAVAAIGL